MDKEIQAAIIAAVSGVAGAILGGIIGAVAAWWAASSTNRVQQQIADSNSKLQREIAEASLAFQKTLAEDNERTQRRTALEAMMLKLSEFAMQWPTVEKDDYCKSYPACTGDPNGKERYENYCAYLFNTMNALFEFCGQDGTKVKEMFGVEEMVKRHWRCWDGDKGNLTYEQPFRAFIQSVIDDLKRRREIT
jgi:hypothetical protein